MEGVALALLVVAPESWFEMEPRSGALPISKASVPVGCIPVSLEMIVSRASIYDDVHSFGVQPQSCIP